MDMDNSEFMRCKKLESVDLEKRSLWKLHQNRKKTLKEINNDVDDVVDQCLKARRHLDAIEDNNRDLQNEERSLRSQYEALLEKNRKDMSIILRLQNSEALLKQALKKQEENSESLQDVQMKAKEKSLERKTLQDDRQRLLFKSQVITNALRKINSKHKRIYESIEEENRMGKESEMRLTTEMNELRSQLSEDDHILEDWLTDGIKRDDAIHHLQDDMKSGLTVTEDTNKDLLSEGTTDEEVSSIETEPQEENEKDVIPKEKQETEEGIPGETDAEKAFRIEWMRKKTLFEAAEKLKEHCMNFYMLLNQRLQDLNIEFVNVRQWRIDKEAEKNEALERVEKMQELVSQKRRKKPVPPRSSVVELEIWINMQHEANEFLRRLVSRCLLVKVEDSSTYLDFTQTIRDMYLGALHEKNNKKEVTEGVETSSAENELES